MTRSLNSDPLRNFRFQVTIKHPDITGFLHMGFMSVSGLAVQSEVIPYREGGNNTTTRKMPGQSDYGPISLNRGMMAAPVGDSAAGTHEAYDWFSEIFSVQAGSGLGGATTNFRCGVNIDVLAHPITTTPYGAGIPVGQGTPPIKARFQVFNAFPMGLSYSDLEAGGNAVVIERLDLAHEGWLLLTASQADGVFLDSSAGFPA